VLKKPRLLLPVVVGGSVAGALDLTSAFITYGSKVPFAIAAGLLGTGAFHGGPATWLLGVLLHFFIAYSAAAVFCLSSLKLPFLKERFFVCGLFYGIAVFLVMNLIVLPLCAFHKTAPLSLRDLIQGLLVHMFIIGLPISFSAWRLSD
jgi:hypothetical protein